MKIGWLTFRLPAPYYLAIIPGGQASAAALKDFGEQSGTSLTWTVDTASGTSVSVKVTDSTGAINYSSPVTIRESVRSSAQCQAHAYFRGWLQWLLCFYFYCRHRLYWVFYWVSIRLALNVRNWTHQFICSRSSSASTVVAAAASSSADSSSASKATS